MGEMRQIAARKRVELRLDLREAKEQDSSLFLTSQRLLVSRTVVFHWLLAGGLAQAKVEVEMV